MASETDITSRLRRELAETHARLGEAEDALNAIRNGEVDGLVMAGPEGRRIFTLEGAQEPYRLLIEQMSEGALTLSPEGLILYANQPMARLLRTPLEQVIGAELRAFVPPEDQPVLVGLVEQAREGASRGMLSLQRAEAPPIPVRLGLSRLQLDSQSLVCMVVTDLTESRKKEDELRQLHADLERRVEERTSDLAASRLAALNMMEEAVEARKQAEAIQHLLQEQTTALRQAEAAGRLQSAALAAAANGVVITDRAGVIQWVNPAFTKTTGYAFEEAVGQNPRMLQSGKHDREFYHQLWATVLRGEVWRGEIVNRRKDASLYTEETVITPVKDEQGTITHFVAIKQDITEKKLLEAKFLRAQRLEGLGALAGGVAHDLNNVLAPILMASEVLKAQSTNPQTSKLLDMIQTNSERGAGMIRQILAFARGSAGEKIPLQVSHLLKELSKLMQQTFPPNIRCELRVASGLELVLGETTELYQLLLNLCVNARDAMPRGGTITIGAENTVLDETYARLSHGAPPGHYVVLSVADTGSGIPKEIQGKIFDPFFTTKEPGKGTGLGLATVKDIVTGHGGFIHLYSEVGVGTQFKIYLPVAQGEGATEETTFLTLPGGHGELVLVVDDEAAVREIVKATLENYGYRVVTAEDGTQGVARFVEHLKEVQLLLTDIQMPHMDGMALIRALRNIQPGLKVIAASGLSTHSAALQATGINVQAFIVKPFTAGSLLLALEAALHPK